MKDHADLNARKYDAATIGSVTEGRLIQILYHLTKPPLEGWNFKRLEETLRMDHGVFLRHLRHLENLGFIKATKFSERGSLIQLLPPGEANLNEYRAWSKRIGAGEKTF